MSQITHGIRKVLSLSAAYDLMQNLAGAKRARRIFCEDYVRARASDTLLDVGCGTAAILDSLPDGIRYFGFDLSSQYIAAAEKRYGHLGVFHCRDITQVEDGEMPFCDIALATGLLHHLDDNEARKLLADIRNRLNAEGRLLTIDGCFVDGQTRLARAFLKADRGQNVRTPEAYRELAEGIFSRVSVHVRHDINRIPYTHAILECRK